MKKIFLTSKLGSVLGGILTKHGELKQYKKVGFIENAADVYENKDFVENDRRAFEVNRFEIFPIDLRKIQGIELKEKLREIDIIFVSGGNTFYLYECMKESGADEIIREAISAGKFYIGSSAGSVILGKSLQHIQGMDDASFSNDNTYPGIGFLDYQYILPHFGNKKLQSLMDDSIKKYGIENMLIIGDDDYIVL